MLPREGIEGRGNWDAAAACSEHCVSNLKEVARQSLVLVLQGFSSSLCQHMAGLGENGCYLLDL